MSEQFNYGPAASQIGDASTSSHGLMSATDKAKLDGIESQANKTTVSDSLSDTSTTNALSAAQGKVLNDSMTLLSSNIYSGTTTNDILTDAKSIGGTKVFTGTGSSYTGTVPNINYKYGVFFCTKRGSSVHVVACSEYDEYATNTWTGSSWTGWKELALKSNIPNVNVQTGGLTTNVATTFSLTKNFGYIIVKLPQTASSATGYMYFFAKHNGYANVYQLSPSTAITITTSGGSISITTSHQHGGTVGIIEYGS